VSLISCTEEKPAVSEKQIETTPPSDPPKVILEGDDIILARVNGSSITQYELELSIRITLGNQAASRLDENGRRKILESLVASRAIAQVQEAEMSPQELAAIKKKVQAYQEQLFVKQYLAKHVSPQPVSSEMVREYYEAHPERFGSRNFRKYEMITSGPKLRTVERDEIINILGNALENTDWQNWVNDLKQRGYPVSFRKGLVMEKVLHPRLEQVMKSLKSGETSNLIFIKGVPYVVRIVEDQQVPPRPLNKVSNQIRQALIPVQLKKAVKQASEQVLAKSEVIYKEE